MLQMSHNITSQKLYQAQTQETYELDQVNSDGDYFLNCCNGRHVTLCQNKTMFLQYLNFITQLKVNYTN